MPQAVIVDAEGGLRPDDPRRRVRCSALCGERIGGTGAAGSAGRSSPGSTSSGLRLREETGGDEPRTALRRAATPRRGPSVLDSGRISVHPVRRTELFLPHVSR